MVLAGFECQNTTEKKAQGARATEFVVPTEPMLLFRNQYLMHLILLDLIVLIFDH